MKCIEDIESVVIGQAKVQEHRVEVGFRCGGQALIGADRHVDAIAVMLEEVAQAETDIGVVIDDQHRPLPRGDLPAHESTVNLACTVRTDGLSRERGRRYTRALSCHVETEACVAGVACRRGRPPLSSANRRGNAPPLTCSFTEMLWRNASSTRPAKVVPLFQ